MQIKKTKKDYAAVYRANKLREQHGELPPKGKNCQLCGQPPTRRGLQLDHCHTSGKFRGWLCFPCNVALGLFRDNPTICIAAAAYLGAVPDISLIISMIRYRRAIEALPPLPPPVLHSSKDPDLSTL